MEDLIKALNIKEIHYIKICYVDNNGVNRVLKLDKDEDLEYISSMTIKRSEVTD